MPWFAVAVEGVAGRGASIVDERVAVEVDVVAILISGGCVGYCNRCQPVRLVSYCHNVRPSHVVGSLAISSATCAATSTDVRGAAHVAVPAVTNIVARTATRGAGAGCTTGRVANRASNDAAVYADT